VVAFYKNCVLSNAFNLTNDNHAVDHIHPTWAPGGTVIAFASDRQKLETESNDDMDIWLMNSSDGSEKVNITVNYNHSDETEPDWGAASLGQ